MQHHMQIHHMHIISKHKLNYSAGYSGLACYKPIMLASGYLLRSGLLIKETVKCQWFAFHG